LPIPNPTVITPRRYADTWPGRFTTLLLGGVFAIALLLLPARTHAQTTTHIVAPGETLSTIAEQYGTTEAALMALNDIAEPDRIIVGQSLLVPNLVPLPTAGPGQHSVAPGETLSEIAKQYGVDLAALMAANRIDNPDSVYSGQVLDIPGQASTPSQPESSEQDTGQAAQPGSASDTYTVAEGDTLTAIARRFGLTPETLRALNSIGDADSIYAGQVLTLVQPAAPAATATPSPEPSPAGTATPVPATATPESPATYTVQAGDTLSAIARRFNLDLATLRAINGIGDADTILVGQTIQLAAATPPTEEASPPTAVETPVAENGEATDAPAPTVEAPIERSGDPLGSLNRTYTIRPGDTLGLIALRTGVDADSLRRLNRFDSLNAGLSAGRQLLLPATGDELRPRTLAREHRVAPGESLSQIAASYGVSLGALLQANRIADPNAVFPGQALLIPSVADGENSGRPITPIGPPRSGFYYYTVQPGDTMSTIAKALNTTMLAIQTYNNLPNSETVYNGMELKIPYGPPPLALTLPPVPISGTRFVVSLSRQQCWVYQGERLLHSWPCSTGAGERRTKAGNYAVQSKILNAKSNIWRLDMPYWLGIYDVGPYENGVHGLPVAWQTGKKIWSGLIGQPATFGCAMLNDTDASTLFRLAYLGMPVHVIN